MFLYNNKLFQQIEGFAIGRPLTPTIMANFFLGHKETKML